MRRLENLIEDSREETENDEFTADAGIQDKEFIRYANDAQSRLQSKIFQKSQKVFISEYIFSTVSRQESYELPYDILFENAISNVQFSSSPAGIDYYPLEQSTLKERNTIGYGEPSFYIRRSGKILLNPVPTGGGKKVRVSYVKRLPKMDTRRAKILTVTTSGSSITSLTLDTGSLLDSDALLKESRFSVVNSDGNQLMRRILYTDINSTTGVVTIDPSFLFESGETIAVGNYLVKGEDSCNKSELPFNLERYLLAYMNWKILKRDSSSDSAEAQGELIAMEDEIISSFGDVDDDIERIPIISSRMLIDDEIV